MNEEETKELSERSNKFASLDPHEYVIRKISYFKGALDQDPISRKAEREKIKAAICLDPTLMPILSFGELDALLKMIENLP